MYVVMCISKQVFAKQVRILSTTRDILALMQFVCNHYCNKRDNSGKKQVSVQCFCVLCSTPCHTKTVLGVVDGFFYVHTDYVGGIPFFCSTDKHGDFARDKCILSFRRKMSCKDCHSGRHDGIPSSFTIQSISLTLSLFFKGMYAFSKEFSYNRQLQIFTASKAASPETFWD